MNSEATSLFPDALIGDLDTTRSEVLESQSAGEVNPKIDNPSKDRESLVKDPLRAPGVHDELLFQELRCGNKEALATIFRKYGRMVRTVAYRILRNEAEADDLLQEVFIFIFRKVGLFDSAKGSVRSWIVQITYHRAIDRRRQLISRHFYDGLDLEAPAAASLHTEIAFYERSLEGTLGRTVLGEIEESLSHDQGETLRLYFFEGYTIEEIAQKMGQTPGNVRNHYYRALEKMRKLIFSAKLPPK
jgi:RNA polymerase sigma-70 factor (ECF subfamily)